MGQLQFGLLSEHHTYSTGSHLVDRRSCSSLKVCARWIKFTTPLIKVIQFPDEKLGPLRGCVLCVSRDSTIAAIVVDGFQL